MTAKNRRPGEAITGAAQELGGARGKGSTSSPHDGAARLRDADDTLEAVWEGLAAGWLTLDQLHARSDRLFAIYMLGFDHGIAAQAEQLRRQYEHTFDRLYLRAMNPPERAAQLEHRLDRALAACPPDIELHSTEYFEWALRHVFTNPTRTEATA